MPVKFDKTSGLIQLYNHQISYIIQLLDHRYPVHRYFGRYLPNYCGEPGLPTGAHAFATDPTATFPYAITSLPLEYATIGSGDYRQPSYLIKDAANQLLPLLTYTGMTVTQEPLNPEQLPPTVKAGTAVTTLILHLSDTVTQLKLDLNYTIFEDSALILRSTTLINAGSTTLMVDAAASLQLDLADANYKALTFSGTHAHEAQANFTPLHPGLQSQRSLRGTSGPQHQPFVALARPQTTEFTGEVLGSALVWSGNFQHTIEVDQYQQTRLTIGLEPTTFTWKLAAGTTFQTPEAVLSWSDQGFNGLSQSLHAFANQMHPTTIHNPIALNTWETLGFDVSAAKMQPLIQTAQKLGLTMVVLDDGWFVNRNSEHGQLGDWVVDSQKFPQGLRPLAEQAHQAGLKFGLWVEPEMITMTSQLYQQHPDWALHYQQRAPITARHQLVLDLSRTVVRQHLLTTLTTLITTNHLDYLKWDMNRHLTQVGNDCLPSDQQDELYYRYVLGLYDLLGQLRARFPALIIENCSAGGGRLDFGMLAYTDQTWLSDLTDPVDRATIIKGFSYQFPQSVFSSHVAASPNAQNGRATPLKTRLDLATIGQLGFELDLNTLSATAQAAIKNRLKTYQTWQPLFKTANFYRLATQHPATTEQAWLLVTADQKHAICFYTAGLSSAVKVPTQLPLRYLNETASYQLTTGGQWSGQELNQVGLSLAPPTHDFETKLLFLHQV
ncbi:alpha-galactosidase [Lactobacillus sp. CBA3605]|uniref:alpha-galactosidase n=1 Tax=Lactobacillus sp. CBA3605 TaxID=2099788 RepID=UPI000CFAF97D|nr:alpha-galactosidase [Lactobacillus sp. CBA3605]AVK61642.1 alpha-galactosidase [Lactobacillus sp. CBA3605]